MIAPGSWLGVLGGGQLGKFFTAAAQGLGYRVIVLDPDCDSPAARVADRHLCADYADADALRELGHACRGVTTEFENVPAASLAALARMCEVRPGAYCVEIVQDRTAEKRMLQRVVDTVAYAEIPADAEPAPQPPDLFPGILRTVRQGCDGKGQIRVASGADLSQAFQALGRVACILERHADFECELSVIVARSSSGEIACYPPVENIHRNGILHMTLAPARISQRAAFEAMEAGAAIAEALEYEGVLGVELFLMPDGGLVANGVAPRPHNSGHYTLDACVCSQFEQQVRVLAGAPLGCTVGHSAAVMVNLLGDLWPAVAPPDWRPILRQPGVRLHLYGKSQPAAGRKMGHYTCTGPTLDHALMTARVVEGGLQHPQSMGALPGCPPRSVRSRVRMSETRFRRSVPRRGAVERKENQ